MFSHDSPRLVNFKIEEISLNSEGTTILILSYIGESPELMNMNSNRGKMRKNFFESRADESQKEHKNFVIFANCKQKSIK